MQVHNEDLWQRILLNGSLGVGEAYMNGWWDCDQLDEFSYRVLRARLQRKIRSWVDLLSTLRTTASEGLFILEDWHSFGTDYDRTLMAWHENFNRHWDEIKDRYGERFYRMWTYYLCSSAGAFRARSNQLWQTAFSPHGVEGDYVAPR